MPICCWRPGKYHNETCVERWPANKNPANIVHLNLYRHEWIISSIKRSIASIFCDKLPFFQLNWGISSVCCELLIVEGGANPVILFGHRQSTFFFGFLISYRKLVACRSANRKRQLANLGSMKPTPKIALIWGGACWLLVIERLAQVFVVKFWKFKPFRNLQMQIWGKCHFSKLYVPATFLQRCEISLFHSRDLWFVY